jgi:sarcosine oxidase
MNHFTYLVIGKGLMGAAASRYLSQWGKTAVIGPDEPADWQTHTGVFASHYDQGRITRRLSKDQVWSELAQAAIAQYAPLEAASGISFHQASGGLYVAPDPNDPYFQLADGWGRQQGIDYARLTPSERQARFPFLDFPAGWPALWEGPPAGYINPRDLIKAQLAVARQQGATIIGETAVSLHLDTNSIRIVTDAGQTYQADKVLLATGAFSNCFDLLPQPLPLRVKSEIIILAEVDEAEVERLAGMPTVIYEIQSADEDRTRINTDEHRSEEIRVHGSTVLTTGPRLSVSHLLADIYLLPPIRYPNGRIYLKIISVNLSQLPV